MKSIASLAGKYGVVSSVALRNKFAYLANSWGPMLTYGLFVFVFSRIWAVAYADKAQIAGYTRVMSVWYFIVAEVVMFGFGRFFAQLSRDVKDGSIAYALGRPYSFLGYCFAERMGPAFLDAALLLCEGLVLGLLATGTTTMVSPLQVLALACSLALSGCLGFFLQTSIALTAFWLEENSAFYWIYQKIALVAGTLIPIEFLPDLARRIVVWTPFPYLAYAPARIAVAWDPAEAGRLLAVQAIWCLAAALLAKAVFEAGRKSVEINGG